MPIEITVGAKRDRVTRVYVSPFATRWRARGGDPLRHRRHRAEGARSSSSRRARRWRPSGKLAGGIAHDFNNVLTAIIGFSDLLLQTHRPTDPAYKDIMNIKSNANRAAGLVRQLLAFSRRQTLQTEVLQLGDVLTDLVRAAQALRSARRSSSRSCSGRDLWYVKADSTQFEQVDHQPRRQRPRRDARRRHADDPHAQRRRAREPKLRAPGMPAGEYVLIEVDDTGHGMTPRGDGQDLRAVLHHQGSRQGHRPRALDRLRHRQADRRLHLRRERARQGHDVPHLPAAPRAERRGRARRQAARRRRSATRDLTGIGRVLLVEDEDVVRTFAVRALAAAGLRGARGRRPASRRWRSWRASEGKIDIVVSDVVMPEMDGPTLLEGAAQDNPDLKIIFVSGYPDDAFKTSLDEDEDFAFLPKPFTLPQLAAKVKEELARE